MRMNRFLKKEMNKARKKLSGIKGMTMGELLVVVAIIAILAGVSFIAVQRHQRSLGQLERDGIAKEIFVAAQNHLTSVYGQNYLGLTEESAFGEKDGDIYYFVGDEFTAAGTSVLDQMLPFGSIDETVRSGGSFIISYQRSTGLVLDVWYCSTGGTPAKFNKPLNKDDYSIVKDLTGDEKKKDRRDPTHSGGYILGWYGAEKAKELDIISLKAPLIKSVNAERLHVLVKDPNMNDTELRGKYYIDLIITGAISEARATIRVLGTEGAAKSNRVKDSDNPEFDYDVILDDITEELMHFANIQEDPETSLKFIPGEDIRIEAKVSGKTLSNIAYSSEEKTNSLFSSIDDVDKDAHTDTTDGVPETAYISNFRHLENLDKTISALNKNDVSTVEMPQGRINIIAASQANDLDWEEDDENFWKSKYIVKLDGSRALDQEGYYMPVNPNPDPESGDGENISFTFRYDGEGHKISNIKAKAENAGLFGVSSYITEIKNLELIDFDVEGTVSAGALAGSLSTDSTGNPNGTVIINVVARNSGGSTATNVRATGSCGGLVGEITAGKVLYSGASVVVKNTDTSGTAGGLIGTISNASDIFGCYSSGHTRNGSYEEWINTKPADTHTYDVIGTTAGGLIGDADGANIESSYSTCSVFGTTAGGFVGTASGFIKNCYATGLIKMDDASASNANKTKGAFAGAFTGTGKDCLYYSIINEVKKKEDSKDAFDHYLGAVGDEDNSEITAIDENVGSYDDFVGEEASWGNAKPYDNSLIKYYTGNYNLKSVQRLTGTSKPQLPDEYEVVEWDDLLIDTHYGDWPAPEIFVFNTAS